MNPELLLSNYQGLSDSIHDSSKTDSDRLTVRKGAVLAELESAHMLIYQQRATQAIKAEMARQKKAEKSKKKNSMYITRDREEHNLNNIIQYDTYINLSKKIDPFEKPKEDPQDAAIQGLAFNAAQSSVSQDQGIASFRQRLAELEQTGDKVTLEALIDAAHDVAVTAPHSSQEFLQTLDTIGTEDQVVYATVVSQLFRDQTGPMGGNPLLSRLQTITPRRVKQDPFGFKQEDDDDPFSLIKEDRQEKYGDLSLINFGLGRRTLDLSSPSFDLGLNSGLGIDSIYDLKLGGVGNWNENASFFSELREIYRQTDSDVAHEWLEEANKLFAEDWSKGRDFAVKSRPTVTTYVNKFGWDFSQLSTDYSSLGSSVFSVASIASHYEGIDRDRLTGLVRELIDDGDTEVIESLSKSALPKEQTGTVQRLLPAELSNREFVDALESTSVVYQASKDNNVDSRFVAHRVGQLQKQGCLEDYLQALTAIETQLNEYAEFANTQRENRDINLGFNDTQAQQTLELYVDFMGKSFKQFSRDFQATGTAFQRLPQIRDTYGKFLDEGNLRSFMNYVAKQRSRDLINDLSQSTAPSSLIESTVLKLGQNTSKKDTVNNLRELNRTYSFLSSVGATDILENRLANLEDNAGSESTFEAVVGSRRECYTTVTGSHDVPEHLTDLIDNVVVGYHKNTGRSYGVDIQPALRFIAETYLADGADASFDAIKNHERNAKVRSSLIDSGVDVGAFERGISRTYHVSTAGDQLQRIKERIDSEFEQIYDRLTNLEIEEVEINQLQELSLKEQLEGVEKILGSYEFDEETKPFKLEIKGHIQTARSINGSMKEMETDASFYVSTDPLEALHMGQYFGSCLSLSKNHGGMNGWASVVQVMDANKNVIYARSEDGSYLGRNRTAITDQGILTTRFYQNGNMALEDGWIDYLSGFADEVHQDVMIPTMFASSAMQGKLETMMQEGNVTKEQRSVQVAPAYFSAFYGDGLSTQTMEDGSIKVDAEVYVIKTQNPAVPKPEEKKPWYQSLKNKVFSPLS